MEPSPQGGVPSGPKRVIENLVRGHGHAKELEDILAASASNNPDWDGERVRDLAEKVRRSFDETVSELMNQGFELKVDNRLPVNRGKPNSSEGSEGSVHSYLVTPRGRRGCYKRRRNGETWTEFSPGMNADGHQWRKYGRKPIYSTAHPRHYFRCTHKTDKGCQATKQVQKVSDNPIKFRTVYQGHHTCNDDRSLKIPQTVFNDHRGSNDHVSNNNSSFLLSFDHHGSRIDTPPVKNEEISEDLLGNKGAALVSSASSEYNNYCGLLGLQGDMMSAPSPDLGDAASASHHGSYWDTMTVLDDVENFMFYYGSPSGDGFDRF